jgi:hypothetical protein
MQWGKRTFAGQRYDLMHLDPRTVEVPATATTAAARVRVLFGAHVFTQSWKDGDPEDFKFMDGGTPRRFCPDRHAHSVHLPGIIERSTAARVLISPQRRFIILGNPPGVAFLYAVCFRMRPVSNYDALIEVVSAHERPRLDKMPGIPFAELVELVSSRRFEWPKK